MTKKKSSHENGELHVSVLLEELVKSIKIHKNKQNIVVDCTL
jgi:16S rRNA C1402 N4-methylase RsmH